MPFRHAEPQRHAKGAGIAAGPGCLLRSCPDWLRIVPLAAIPVARAVGPDQSVARLRSSVAGCPKTGPQRHAAMMPGPAPCALPRLALAAS